MLGYLEIGSAGATHRENDRTDRIHAQDNLG